MGKLVHEYLINNLDKNGESILIKEKDNELTHKELEQKSNQFSNYLFDIGVRKNDRVLLLMESSINANIVLFGIMKRGAIFVPVNAKNTTKHIDDILNTIEPVLVVVDDNYKNKLDNINYLNENNTKIMINGMCANQLNYLELEHYNNFNIEMIEKPRLLTKDLLYIIFTSGSTGKPKGVMVRHESVCQYMDYVVPRFNHNKNTITLCISPLSFDPYLTEIVPSIISGGTIVIHKSIVSMNNFLKLLEKEGITNFGCGPSLLQLLVTNSDLIEKYNLSSLNKIYFGYENCNVEIIRSLQKLLPNVTFIHGYGTSETYASNSFYEVENLTGKDFKALPFGDPIEGIEFLVLDDKGNQVKEVGTGELVIRGTSLMNGYWRDEEKSRQVLKLNPVFPDSREKVYFTGDLVEITKDNQIIFKDRKDSQVKVLGYRVELTEIQRSIFKHELVENCVVLAIEQDDFNKIICFIKTKNNEKNELDQVKKYCIENLETYKVPKQWVLIDEFPKNKNNKIDKNQLKRNYKEKKLI